MKTKTVVKLGLLIGLMTLLTGCITLGGGGQLIWFNPIKTNEEVQQDLANARLDAQRYGYVAPSPYGDPMTTGFTAGFLTADRQNQIMKAYMEARGYRLIRRDALPKDTQVFK